MVTHFFCFYLCQAIFRPTLSCLPQLNNLSALKPKFFHFAMFTGYLATSDRLSAHQNRPFLTSFIFKIFLLIIKPAAGNSCRKVIIDIISSYKSIK